MFNRGFYPTPINVANLMVGPYWRNLYGTHVLDPQGGKGDLLDYIKQGTSATCSLYTCEIEPDLRAILTEKGYSILANDFLTYTPEIFFDYIFMNPPFAEAEEHIFHAWKILGKGTLVSLVDVRSLEGKNSKEQLLLSMIENNNGKIERIGKVFTDAERTTGVEVAIIRLEKDDLSGFRIDFDPTNTHDDKVNIDEENNDLALEGFIDNLLAAYDAAVGHYREYMKARLEIEKYVGAFHRQGGGYDQDILKEADSFAKPQARYNAFVSSMRDNAWGKILDYPKFQAVLTEKARKMVAEFRSRQVKLDFNPENIGMLLDTIAGMSGDLLAAAVDDAFDTMTKYHKDNRVYYEGWKSNKYWKVSRKVVLPYFVEHSPYGNMSVRYQYRTQLDDIDRAMCVVAKKPFSEIRLISTMLESAFSDRGYKANVVDTEFFTVRAYQKGTIHLTFKSEKVWKDFNYQAARNKKWLPDSTD